MTNLSVSKSVFMPFKVPLNTLRQNQESLTMKVPKGHDKNMLKCENITIRLAEERLPKTGLVSFPGSGNTWTRHLLQQVSGEI